MLRGFFGNLIFAIIARMLCGNHLNASEKRLVQQTFFACRFCFPNTDHVTIPSGRFEPLSCSLKRTACEHDNVQL